MGAAAKRDNVVELGTDAVALEAEDGAADLAGDVDLAGVERKGQPTASKSRVKLSCAFHPPYLDSGTGEDTTHVDGAGAATSSAGSAEKPNFSRRRRIEFADADIASAKGADAAS